MRSLLFILLTLAAGTRGPADTPGTVGWAQTAVGERVTAPVAEFPMCYYTTAPGTEVRGELPRGFVVTTTRAADPDAADEACTVRVIAPGGAVVYERTGFGVRVLPVTGQDLDADGVPDLVLSVDDGGGNRCCWGTIVLRLAPPLKVLVDVPFAVGWQLDPPRGALAEETVAFYSLGPSMAESPTLTRVYRVSPAGLRDVTGDFCDRLLSPAGAGGFDRRHDWAVLTPAQRRASRGFARSGAAQNDDAVSQTRVSATSIALQYLECGRAADARALVDEVWPASEAPARWQTIADAAAARRPK